MRNIWEADVELSFGGKSALPLGIQTSLKLFLEQPEQELI
jgi:hypothetical protein